MDQVKDQLKVSTAILDPFADKIPGLKDAAEGQGVNSGLILFVILLFTGLIVFFIMGFMGYQIIVCALSVLYPGLRSIRALITKEGDDDKEWLTYSNLKF